MRLARTSCIGRSWRAPERHPEVDSCAGEPSTGPAVLGVGRTAPRWLPAGNVVPRHSGLEAHRGRPQEPGQQRDRASADRSFARAKDQRVNVVLANDSLEGATGALQRHAGSAPGPDKEKRQPAQVGALSDVVTASRPRGRGQGHSRPRAGSSSRPLPATPWARRCAHARVGKRRAPRRRSEPSERATK